MGGKYSRSRLGAPTKPGTGEGYTPRPSERPAFSFCLFPRKRLRMRPSRDRSMTRTSGWTWKTQLLSRVRISDGLKSAVAARNFSALMSRGSIHPPITRRKWKPVARDISSTSPTAGKSSWRRKWIRKRKRLSKPGCPKLPAMRALQTRIPKFIWTAIPSCWELPSHSPMTRKLPEKSSPGKSDTRPFPAK